MTESLVVYAFGNTPPPDLASLQFTNKARNTCTGCMFEGCTSKTCRAASDAAILAGLRDCDDGFIYVPVTDDPRQLTIPIPPADAQK